MPNILKIRIIFYILIIFSLSGCTMLGTYMNAQNPAPEYRVNGKIVETNYIPLTPSWVVQHREIPTYHVGSYDILNIIVWDHPELTTPSTQLSTPAESGILVDGAGYISFPFAGTLKVTGLSITEIQQLIARKISKYVRNPQVTVRVASFRSKEVQVLGEVGGNKTVPLTDKPLSLLDALNDSGGTNAMTADTSRIYVIRGDVTHLTVFGLNAKSPETMMTAQQFILKENDIIYVPPVTITNWNRVISQILPSFSGALTAKSVSDAVK